MDRKINSISKFIHSRRDSTNDLSHNILLLNQLNSIMRQQTQQNNNEITAESNADHFPVINGVALLHPRKDFVLDHRQMRALIQAYSAIFVTKSYNIHHR